MTITTYRPFPVWKCLLAIIFTTAYGFVMSFGFVVIDPCSCTPGYDYNVGLTMAGLFPFLLGALLYVLFGRSLCGFSNWFHIKTFLKSVAIATIWLIAAYAVFFLELILAYYITTYPVIPVPDFLIRTDCLAEKEPSELFMLIMYLIAVCITGWLARLIAKRRYNESNL